MSEQTGNSQGAQITRQTYHRLQCSPVEVISSIVKSPIKLKKKKEETIKCNAHKKLD